jgi:hypothetical protein
MRRLNATILLLIFLSSSTELHQFLRLPVLFSHYHEHKKYSAKISFADFIVFHYFNNNIGDTDFAHNELPFKDSHCEALHITVAILPENFEKKPCILFNPESTKGIYKSQLLPSSTLSSIWQPPRV